MKRVRILLVEDEARVAAFIAKGLREQTYAVDIASDGEQALYQAAVNEYDLVILDVMLPLKDGHAVCRELRAAGFGAPILMLTARAAVDDRVAGLDSGADDYLAKPSTSKSCWRACAPCCGARRDAAPGDARGRPGPEHRQPRGYPRRPALSLTAKEYALLEFLVLNENRVVGREQIAQHVWDESFDAFSNVIDV